ncbi:MAG: UDP-2,3-diacylglucosamine diphosphatase [Cytophagales bacterium]|nr:UDP-2,3-diacylglucosamine diphosphatase [Cytophagales bacterium]MDW8385306.1 UDP-2,3-diacylglucosamine diphosphatase [Flammeovirgaceae bacterium]
MKSKRKVELVIISDVHLGTYGCQAKELLRYLKSIQPQTLVLNGDIIDMWQFSKNYFPKSHTKVLKYLLTLISKGTKVYYVTGNHDEMLRKFAGFRLGTFELVNKIVLEFDGKKAWIFHGDAFDVTMQYSKWLAKLGAIGYDLLILLNVFVNWCLERLGKEKMSFSKRVKNGVKSAVKFINQFEMTAAEIAIEKGYDYVICGHIHQPEHRTVTINGKSVVYLNSGDWIENLTSLEYNEGTWSIYNYLQAQKTAWENVVTASSEEDEEEPETEVLNNKELFNNLLSELQVAATRENK